MNIGAAMERAVEARPETAAIWAGRDTLTFKELLERVRTAGSRLVTITDPGDRVLFSAGDTVEGIATCLAAWYTGRTAVHIPPYTDVTGLHELIEQVDAPVFLFDTRLADVLAEARDDLSVDLFQIDGDPVRDARPLQAVDKSDHHSGTAVEPASITFTSGTTGTPKPVPVSHSRLLHAALSFVVPMEDARGGVESVAEVREKRLNGGQRRDQPIPEHVMAAFIEEGVWAGDTYFDFFPISHAAGAATTLFGVIAGATNVAVDDDDPAAVATALDAAEPTIIGGLPHQLQSLYAETRGSTASISSVEIVHTGGSWSEEGLLEETRDLGAELYNSYASSETMQISYAFNSDAIGSPTFLHDLRLVPPGERPSTVDTADFGEIAVSTAGATVIDAYWQDSEATADNFVDGWFLTGDIARRDDEGRLWFEGRVDNILTVDGKTIVPERLERVLATHPKVTDAAVIGIEDSPKEVVACVVASGPVERDDLHDHLTAAEKELRCPDTYWFVDSIPRHRTSGIDRGQLRERYEEES